MAILVGVMFYNCNRVYGTNQCLWDKYCTMITAGVGLCFHCIRSQMKILDSNSRALSCNSRAVERASCLQKFRSDYCAV